MSFTRANIKKGAQDLTTSARAGDGWNVNLAEFSQAADSNQVLGVAAINAGLYVRSGMTAGRTDTTDTAANILAANPGMDIGDSFVFAISNTVAFILTLAGGVGVTLVGKTTVAASGSGFFTVTKTGAATVTIRGI